MAINKDKLCYIHKKEPYSETLQKKQGIGISNQIKECYKLLQIEITKQAWNVCSQFSSVQFSSVVQSCPTLCDPMDHSTPGFPFLHHSQNSLRLTSIKSVMPSSHLILGHPLLLLPQSLISVTQLCSILCDPMDYRAPNFPVHHQLPELAQTHAIKSTHPLSFPSPPDINLSQHQSHFL